MTKPEIEAAILTILESSLRVPVDLEASRVNIPQWDSLKHVEVMFAIEDALGVEFSESELAELSNVSSIVTAILVRHAA